MFNLSKKIFDLLPFKFQKNLHEKVGALKLELIQGFSKEELEQELEKKIVDSISKLEISSN